MFFVLIVCGFGVFMSNFLIYYRTFVGRSDYCHVIGRSDRYDYWCENQQPYHWVWRG